jgi:hypothetical protein
MQRSPAETITGGEGIKLRKNDELGNVIKRGLAGNLFHGKWRHLRRKSLRIHE